MESQVEAQVTRPASTSRSPSPATPPRSSSHHKGPAALRPSPRHRLHYSPRAAAGRGVLKSKTPPKARRKKTLPEDKAILDAAYELNPTPDKAARRELVRRCIDMSEARIQIWFQNRRQIDRRKSEPVPSKVEAFTHGRIQVLSPDMVCHKNKSFELGNLAVTAAEVPTPLRSSGSPPNSHALSCPPVIRAGAEREAPVEGKGASWEWSGMDASHKTTAPAPLEMSGGTRPALSRSFSGTTGYLANRRNPGSLYGPLQSQESLRSEPFSSSCPPSTSSGPVPEPLEPRPSSQSSRICLSLSLDGRAEITESTSSPPRPVIPRAGGSGPGPLALSDSVHLPPLQLPEAVSESSNPRRSLSAVSPVDSAPQSQSAPMPRDPRISLKYVLDPIHRPPSLRRCRSSDVQAWEDCANSAKLEDPLIRQAKHESSGSAVAAIHLVRSTSSVSSSVLKQRSNNAKRRTILQPGVAKRYKTDRLPGARARTDMASGPSQRHNMNAYAPEDYPGGTKPGGTATAFWSNDSDKENWSPDEDGNPRPFRGGISHTRAPSSSRRPLPSAPPAASRLDANRNPRRTSAQELHHAMTSLRRGNTSPGGWSKYSRRYRDKANHLSRSQSALEIYEDEEEDDDHSGAREAAAHSELLSMCGVSPSKEKDVAAATGLLSLKWGR